MFNKITNLENLFLAWTGFKKGKSSKPEVMQFEKSLEQNIFNLHRELMDGTYKHAPYEGFFITDPKLRHVHKASIRDRILHHAMFKILNPKFEPCFISTSFSCQIGKGSHRGMRMVARMLRKVSKNNTLPCYALKCDVRKFFDSIDHEILLSILKKRVRDQKTIDLLKEVIGSFEKSGIRERERGSCRIGVPIGNLTSQLFANVYMNEFDQYIKHELKVKYYARYTDDILIISNDLTYLQDLIKPIENFLAEKLALKLHPNKTTIRKYHHGVDFLGYVIFPNFILVRKVSEKRMFRKCKQKILDCNAGKITKESLSMTIQSYVGMLSHADAYKLTQLLKNQQWFLKNSNY